MRTTALASREDKPVRTSRLEVGEERLNVERIDPAVDIPIRRIEPMDHYSTPLAHPVCPKSDEGFHAGRCSFHQRHRPEAYQPDNKPTPSKRIVLHMPYSPIVRQMRAPQLHAVPFHGSGDVLMVACAEE